jgi:prepilin-type N-terminal cleavage/methylation domain-containing protein
MSAILRNRKVSPGFTLIELLIVIAIILILISIALPNFLAAQARAKVVREESDMRTIAIAIEALRSDYNILLVDFWDDDVPMINRYRFNGSYLGMYVPAHFGPCCSWHRHDWRGGTTGLFAPLTTPIPYIKDVPRDPFSFERGDLTLIDQDVIPPISYMYHDRESEDMKLRAGDFTGVPGTFGPSAYGQHGILKPLGMDHFLLVGFGPDLQRDGSCVPYAPTNGVKSYGDVVRRSDG